MVKRDCPDCRQAETYSVDHSYVNPKRYWVNTPGGIGQVWGIDRGQVLVEFDFATLVGFDPSHVERMGDDV